MINIEKFLNYCKDKDKLYCYGAGKYGRITRAYLHENAIEISGYIVSRNIKGEEKVLEIPVWGIDEFMRLNQYDKESTCPGILICISSKFREEVLQRVQENGIKDYVVLEEELIKEMDDACNYDEVFEYDGYPKILLYHRVNMIKNDIWKLANTPEDFDMQIRYLKEHYNVVRFEDEWDEKGKNQVAITFDDGYEDNYLYALPILEKYKIPAIIFVCTGNIDRNNEFWWDELERLIFYNDTDIEKFSFIGKEYQLKTYDDKIAVAYSLREKMLVMSFEERNNSLAHLRKVFCDKGFARKENYSINVDEMKKIEESPYMTIGGHTVTHTRLTSLLYGQQEREIKDSKEFIEQIIGHKIDCFSYPFGGNTDYNDLTIKSALSAGYKKIAAIEQRYFNKEQYCYNLPRIGVQGKNGSVDNREFRRLLTLG